jgi:hypothetical protein
VDVQEPGLDRHEWETEWEDLEERLETDAAGALSDVDNLIARMLEARGLPLEEQPGESDAEPETVREFLGAREVTRRLEAGEDVDPGDVGYAAEAYSELYHMLLERGPS